MKPTIPEPLRARIQAGLNDIAPDLRSIRSVRSLRRTWPKIRHSIESLLASSIEMMPALVIDHPLPLDSLVAAKIAVGTSAALTAIVETGEEFAVFETFGLAAPTAPMVAAASLLGFIAEAYAGASYVVYELRRRGHAVDAEMVGRILMDSYARRGPGHRPTLTRAAVEGLGRRWMKRLIVDLAPGIGVAYNVLDSQRALARLVDALPPPASPARRALLPGAARTGPSGKTDPPG